MHTASLPGGVKPVFLWLITSGYVISQNLSIRANYNRDILVQSKPLADMKSSLAKTFFLHFDAK